MNVEIRELVNKLNEQFSGGHIIPQKEENSVPQVWLDTGSFTLNKAISKKGLGLPTGHLVEMYGESATGKSLISLHVAKSCIEKGGIVLYFDVEGSFDFDFAESLGLDTTKLILVQPTVEDKDGNLVALSITDVFKRTEFFINDVRSKYGEEQLTTIILDSLASVNFEEDLEKDGPTDTQGRPEKRIKHWIRRIRPLVNATNTLWLIINQVYDKMSRTPTAQPLATPGGRAVGFHSQIRVEWQLKLGKDGKVYDGSENIIGARLHFKVAKNRVGPPWMTGYVNFLFGENGEVYMDRYSGYLEYLVAKGAVEKGRGKITVGEDSYRARSEENKFLVCSDIDRLFSEHPELLGV